MVILYGIAHGGQQIDCAGNDLGEISLFSSDQFISSLKGLPKGSRVGIETFIPSDRDKLKQHVESQGGYIGGHGGSYWEDIVEICESAGHEVIFLDEIQSHFKLFRNVKRMSKLAEFARNNQYIEENETEKQYDFKLINFNESLFRAEIEGRDILELQRDALLLERIKSSNLDAAIVGAAHGNYWFFEMKDPLFKDYFEDLPAAWFSYFANNDELSFVDSPKRNNEWIWGRKSLERYVRLIKEKRMTDGNPNFVGVWAEGVTMSHPSKNYFELFVEGNNGGFEGRIEDGLGSAVFTGERDENSIQFMKEYIEGKNTIARGKIRYLFERVSENEFYGRCRVGGAIIPVFMIEGSRIKPAKIARRSYPHENNYDLNRRLNEKALEEFTFDF